MINIIIVEDNAYKLETIKKLLNEDLLIEDQFIHIASSIKQAKKLMNVNFYDLLILDLVLPLESGDDPTPEKGVSFLRDITMLPSLNPPTHIIGVTEFSDFKSQFDENFSNNLWYLLNYQASETFWQEKLKTLVSHLINIRSNFVDRPQNEIIDVAILTALNSPEFDKVLELSSSWQEEQIKNDSTKYYNTTFISSSGREIKVIAACVDQMGMTAMTNLATKVIFHYKPKYIFLSGICAGLKDRELNYGDIIIAEQSWDYGSGKIKEHLTSNQEKSLVFEPDPRPLSLSPELKAKVNSFLRRKELFSAIQNACKYFKPNFVLQAKLGPVASGSYVIASEEILIDIKQHHRKLLGVEMEAYGLHYAAENSYNQQTKAMMVKSVCDFGDTQKDDLYQDYASYTSAQFLFNFIIHELFR